jgi:hypothetical protein
MWRDRREPRILLRDAAVERRAMADTFVTWTEKAPSP